MKGRFFPSNSLNEKMHQFVFHKALKNTSFLSANHASSDAGNRSCILQLFSNPAKKRGNRWRELLGADGKYPFWGPFSVVSLSSEKEEEELHFLCCVSFSSSAFPPTSSPFPYPIASFSFPPFFPKKCILSNSGIRPHYNEIAEKSKGKNLRCKFGF